MPRKEPTEVKEVWNSKIEQGDSNTHISYSQLSTFTACPKKWQRKYIDKEAPFLSSIYTVFGTAFHETLQEWLTVLYKEKIKDAMEMDLEKLLYKNIVEEYQKQRESSNDSFSSPEELQLFYLDGIHILEYIKKHRAIYFSRKEVYLAGIETLLYVKLQNNTYFKGFVDLVLYDKDLDMWEIVDIKTSTKGWNKWAKSDESKTAQILLYKHHFSEQFGIPIEKIKVNYFIVKRQIPIDPEFPAMARRVQQFAPPSGKIKTGKALRSMKHFIEVAIDSEGNYLDKQHITTPSKHTCRFCEFSINKSCGDAITK